MNSSEIYYCIILCRYLMVKYEIAILRQEFVPGKKRTPITIAKYNGTSQQVPLL